MSDNIPDEVIVDILSWLPVESISRFKCVCKSWYALFKNPKFVSKHLANQSKDHILLKHKCQQQNGNDITVLSVLSDVVNHADDDVIDLNLKGTSFALVGYCDGIIVLLDCSRDFNVIVCNPGIREFRTLPKSSFHPFCSKLGPLPPSFRVYFYAQTCALGFGYDYKTNDYKVVRVVSFVDEYNINVQPSRFEVFSLRSDTSWRQVKNVAVEAFAFNCMENHTHYLDGVFYWWARDDTTFKEVLLSFDMADEVFRKSPLPYFCDCPNPGDYIDDNMKNRQHLGVYNNESIALFVYPHTLKFAEKNPDLHLNVSEKFIDVWVLKEFGVKESWTKQLRIGPLDELYIPILFWKTDEAVLLQEDDNGQLFYCDPITLETKRLPFHGIRFTWGAVAYMKTLVSVYTREDIV